MKTFRLASIAVQAERVRWQSTARRYVIQAVWLVVALIMVLMAFVVGHAALYQVLLQWLSPPAAFGALAGGDLVLALIAGFLGSRSSPGRAEREAMELSIAARQQIRESFGWARLLAWAFRMVR